MSQPNLNWIVVFYNGYETSFMKTSKPSCPSREEAAQEINAVRLLVDEISADDIHAIFPILDGADFIVGDQRWKILLWH